MAFGAILGQSVSSGFEQAVIEVTGPVIGSVVTMSKDSKTITMTESNGTWSGITWGIGTYTITATYMTAKTVLTKTVTVAVSQVTLYSAEVLYFDKTLSANTWGEIQKAAQSGVASSYWAVGDKHLFGYPDNWGYLSDSSSPFYATIIGFDHNSAREGNNKIHFMVGCTAVTSGSQVAFCDSYYNSRIGNKKYFTMNTTNTNTGGWASSHMRTTVLGANVAPANAPEGSFLNICPDSLQSVITSCTKYTDNTGDNSATKTHVTATTDYAFLLSEYEIYGSCSQSNSYEADYQAQYSYYANGNQKGRFKHNATTTYALWWTRSPSQESNTSFVIVPNAKNDTASTQPAMYSEGVTACFCVG